MKKKFDFICESCEAEYSISFEKTQDGLFGQEIICCPFCGDNCVMPEDSPEDEEDEEDSS